MLFLYYTNNRLNVQQLYEHSEKERHYESGLSSCILGMSRYKKPNLEARHRHTMIFQIFKKTLCF